MGGVPNLVPLAKKEKLYDMRSIPPLTGASGGDQLIIGAGAAPWTFKSRNGEVGRQLYSALYVLYRTLLLLLLLLLMS